MDPLDTLKAMSAPGTGLPLPPPPPLGGGPSPLMGTLPSMPSLPSLPGGMLGTLPGMGGITSMPGCAGGLLGGMLPPPPATGLLSLVIDNLGFRYALSEQDLSEMFGRWGQLDQISVSRDGPREVGVVKFQNPEVANVAKRQLHGYVVFLDGMPGTLHVAHGGPEQFGGRMPLAPQGGSLPSGAMPKSFPPTSPIPGAPPAAEASGAVAANDGGGGGSGGMTDNDNGGSGTKGAGAPAWCCKVIVQAQDLHKDYPTCLKVLGTENANIEHLRSMTGCSVHLRGMGSGYVENDGRELQEAMFLWLSADSEDVGKAGLEMTLDLLKSVYDDHQSWCTGNSFPTQPISDPMVIENPEALPPPLVS